MTTPISFTKTRKPSILFGIAFILWLQLPLAAVVSSQDRSHEFFSPQPLSLFVGRDNELNRLKEELQSQGIAYVVGVPGIGKTSFVHQYSIKSRDQYHFILWLNLSSALEDQLVTFGKIWNSRYESKIPENFLHRLHSPHILYKWLVQQEKKWLVILDDYNPSHEQIIQTLKGHKNISLVIISSEKCSEKPSTIQSLSLKESATLLTFFVGENNNNEVLASLLGNYPLALRQVGILIKNSPSLSVNQYIDHYKRSKKNLEKGRPSKVFGENEMAMEITVRKQSEQLDSDELKICHALTYLNGNNFSYALLKDFASHVGISEAKLHQTLFDLCRHLIIQQKNENEYEIHECIQKTLRESISQKDRERILAIWVDVFKTMLTQDYVSLEKVITDNPLTYQHAKTVLSLCEEAGLQDQQIQELKINLCYLARFYGYDRFYEGEGSYYQNLSDQIDRYLKDHKGLEPFLQARYYIFLGDVLAHKDIRGSIAYATKAIALLEGHRDHRAQAEQFFALVKNLSDYYLEIGDLSSSLECFQKAEKLLNEIDDDPYKFIFYSWRALALMNKGDPEKALDDILIAEKLVTTPMIAIATAKIKAQILSKLGQYDEALKIATHMTEETLQDIDDPTHKVIMLKALIAYCTFKLGDGAKAEKLAHLVLSDLQVYQKTHALDVSLFGYVYRISGEIFMAQNKVGDALVYFHKALDIYQSTYKKFEVDDVSELYFAFVQHGIATNDAPLSTLHFRNQLRNFGLEHPRTIQMISLLDQKGIPVPWISKF